MAEKKRKQNKYLAAAVEMLGGRGFHDPGVEMALADKTMKRHGIDFWDRSEELKVIAQFSKAADIVSARGSRRKNFL